MRFMHRLELRDPTEASRRLRIAVTESCNLRCFFCHGDGGRVRHFRADDSHLSPSEIALAVRAASAAGVRRVKLTGGEPLLYRYERAGIADVIHAITTEVADGGVDVSLTTNGTLLSREVAHDLYTAGLRRITLSLHAATAERFSRYAAPQEPSSFANVLAGIGHAVEAGLKPVKINCVVYHSRRDPTLRNTGELREIAALARSLAVSELRFFVVISNPRLSASTHADTYVYWDDPIFEELYPSTLVSEVREVLAELTAAGLALPGSFRALFRLSGESESSLFPELGFQNLGWPAARAHAAHRTVSCTCQEGAYALRLTTTGDVRACLRQPAATNVLPALRAGNVDSVCDALKSSMEYLHAPLAETIVAVQERAAAAG